MKVKATVEALEPYVVPGRLQEGVVKLDANENPYGPSPKVYEALRNSLRLLYRYPSRDDYEELRRTIASKLGLNSFESVVLGSGSDELIDLTVKAFLEQGETAVTVNPTFPMYRFYVKLAGGVVEERPMTEDFRFDVDGILEALEDGKVKLIMICNPNNPTGTYMDREALHPILETGVLTVVDEAYIEFSRGRSTVDLVDEYENLIVLRTFSKAYGLAGLRIGYAVAVKKVAQILDKVRSPYNVNVLAVKAASAALEDEDYLRRVCRRIVEERRRLYDSLSGIPHLKPFPSEANFILVDATGLGLEAGELRRKLLSKGVSVKTWSKLGLRRGCLFRVTVGRPDENRVFLDAISGLSSEAEG